MGRLIDADRLKANINTAFWSGIEKIIDSAPTIEVTSEWIPCSERLPDRLVAVNITWVNHNPPSYYEDVKDEPFTSTAYYHKDKWWWYSCVCGDMLAEYGQSDFDEIDKDIEVIAWMPLPKPYERGRR